jgi:hypothetical protein
MRAQPRPVRSSRSRARLIRSLLWPGNLGVTMALREKVPHYHLKPAERAPKIQFIGLIVAFRGALKWRQDSAC